MHFFILFVYLLSIVASLFVSPGSTAAAWNNTATWTTKGDFENGSNTGLVINGDNDGGDSNNNDSAFLTSQIERYKTISAGMGNSYAIKADGSLWSVGYNYDGQLGVGDREPRTEWTQIDFAGAKEVSSVGYHVLVLKEDGTVWGAGYNGASSLGDGTGTSRTTFVQAKTSTSPTTYLTNVKRIYTGFYTSFAITNDNKMYAVGHNANGQLGLGNTVNRSLWTQIVTLPGVNDIDNIQPLKFSAAENHSMLLIKDLTDGQNKVFTTGRNSNYELGFGDTTQRNSWTNINISDVVEICAGVYSSHIVVKDEAQNYQVYAVGYNPAGKLGVGDTVSKQVWTVTTIDDVKYLYAGDSSTFAIRNDNTVWAVGNNSYGLLGVGDLSHRSAWTKTSFENVADIANSQRMSVLLLKKDGSLDGVGSVEYGQLGTGEIHNIKVPVQVTAPSGITSLGAGYNNSFYIKNGTLYGTGQNGYSQLGLGDSVNKNYFNQTSITGVTKVSGGNETTTFLKNDGTIWGLGYNSNGTIGNGTTSSTSNVPTQGKKPDTNNLTGVSDFSSGRYHTLAITGSGEVYATGYNAYYQLGNGNNVNQSYYTLVKSGATKIHAGYGFSAVLLASGDLQVIGENGNGQLGVGNTSNVSVWTTTATGVLDIWGGTHALFIRKADGIYATGYNAFGGLGLGHYNVVSSWTKVNSLTDVNYIKAGYGFSVALKNDGTVIAAGMNYFGQIGVNNYVSAASWQVVPVSNVTELATGYYHVIYRKNDGTIWAVGMDVHGQLGINSPYYRSPASTVLNAVRQSSPYNSSGSLTGYKINAGQNVNWKSIIWDADVPTGSVLKVRTRGAATEGGLASAPWSAWITVSGEEPDTQNSQWLEIELGFESLDGIFSPILRSFSVIYYFDTTAPTNPSSVLAWTNSGRTTPINNDSWSNSNTIYLDWTGAADEVDGSGVKGYWVYFGNDATSDPKTAGAFQAGTSLERTIPPEDSGKTFYLSISTEDYAGNRQIIDTEPYYKSFSYKFDKTVPVEPQNTAVSPVGWSVTNNFNFTWDEPEDPVVNGGSSLIAGYKYKRSGGGDNWSNLTTERSISNLQAYQNGQNELLIKAIDVAGNESIPKSIYYYYSADAPTQPRNVTVTPQTSDENNFTFSWDPPETANGGVKGYYYSVNVQPGRNNSTYINLADLPAEVTVNESGRVTLHDIPAATQQDFNTFYVVAIDNSENINWSNFNNPPLQFVCNTTAPGIPLNPEVFDTSNRDLQKYSVAVNWAEPTYKGVGFAGYTIERSLNNEDFSVVGTSAGTSYLDTGLQSREYYYRVMARDNSGNSSAPSAAVAITPTGRYTAAPNITVQPEVTTKVTTAEIRWVTDREASSFVEIGESVNYGLTQGQFDFVSDHKVLIKGLKPDTSYHYRVKFVDEDGNIGYSQDAVLRTKEAPRVIAVEVSEIRLNSAVITWNTSAPAESSIIYGYNSNYSHTKENVSGGFTTSHFAKLTDLTHSSSYHFAIKLKDIDGSEVLSDDYTFETLKYPKVFNVRMEPVKSAASSTMKITWESNVPISSVVEYQPEKGILQDLGTYKLATRHEILIPNLLDNTFYNLTVKGRDQFGNQALSEVQRFKTDYDTRAPKVSDVEYETSIVGYGNDARAQLVVTWATDEPATSQVEFSTGLTGTEYTSRTQEDAALVENHVVILSDLKPSAPYHFRIISRDASNNPGNSDDTTVLTSQAADSVIDLVFKSLQNTVGWIFQALLPVE